MRSKSLLSYYLQKLNKFQGKRSWSSIKQLKIVLESCILWEFLLTALYFCLFLFWSNKSRSSQTFSKTSQIWDRLLYQGQFQIDNIIRDLSQYFPSRQLFNNYSNSSFKPNKVIHLVISLKTWEQISSRYEFLHWLRAELFHQPIIVGYFTCQIS